ncbi:MAG: D-alanyl-lipoteichoic acid biosynthesis protein DltD [Selenomonadaceae bacterium]|nr:D-alanyl-lipoteichoic acid biosynthesis protein DltD [Selenomonadaceae bacterium]
MKQLLVVAFDLELDKIISVINLKDVHIKHIVTLPSDHSKYKKLNCKISTYDELPEILDLNYFDYIIISDTDKTPGRKSRIYKELLRLNVPEDKIIDITFWKAPEIYPLYNMVKFCEVNPSWGDFFITGVSHAYAGIDVSCFDSKGINIAHTSQDLYYDYLLAKKIIDIQDNIKVAFISIAPFSLHYDLSKGSCANRIHIYNPLLNDCHNHLINNDIYKMIFNHNYFDVYKDFFGDLIYNQRLYSASVNRVITVDEYMSIRASLGTWDNKSFTNTVEENVHILNMYVDMCQKSNITPILLMFPVSPWYNKYFSKIKMDEVRTITRDIAYRNKIKLLDYYKSDKFTYNDFYDFQHLNVNGAKKISSMLNVKINEYIGVRKL